MDTYKFSFEKLNVWQLAKNLAVKIYKVTRKFPSEEKYGLTSQITRAAVSVSANLAEGSSRIGPREKSHFYSIAYSSLMELISHLIIAHELGFLMDNDFTILKKEMYEISNKLNALYKSEKSKK